MSVAVRHDVGYAARACSQPPRGASRRLGALADVDRARRAAGRRGPARWRRGRRQEPAAGGAARARAGSRLAGARRPLCRLRRRRAALPSRSARLSAGWQPTLRTPPGHSSRTSSVDRPAAAGAAHPGRLRATRARPVSRSTGPRCSRLCSARSWRWRTDAPLLLIIEDVHWADVSTRELLTFLLTRRSAEPIAIVASYRSDDLNRRHPLRATLAEWHRLPTVTRLHVERLDEADFGVLIAELQPRPLPERDVQRIVASGPRAIPFFAEELVSAAEDGGCVAAHRARRPAAGAPRPARRRRPAGRTGRGRRRPPGAARPARSRLRPRGRRARSGAACGRRGQRAGLGRAATATCSGTRCLPRPCTTTCCPASGCGCTRHMPRRSPRATRRAPPPSWPGTRGPRTTWSPRRAPACGPVTRRWWSAGRTRQRTHYEHGARAAGGPGGRRGGGRGRPDDRRRRPGRPRATGQSRRPSPPATCFARWPWRRTSSAPCPPTPLAPVRARFCRRWRARRCSWTPRSTCWR